MHRYNKMFLVLALTPFIATSCGPTFQFSPMKTEEVSIKTIAEHAMPSGSPELFESTIYRIPQQSIDVDKENGIAKVYEVKQLKNGEFTKSIVRILREENEYIHANDVAAYLQAFNKAPSNYMWGNGEDKVYRDELEKKGENARFKFTYYTGESHRNDYTPNLGPWFEEPGLPYYEFDIADEEHHSQYYSHEKIGMSRGRFRLVVVPGKSQYKYVNNKEEMTFDATCFYTDDHYRSFREYYNYYNGWSAVFDGWETGHGERPEAITITNV